MLGKAHMMMGAACGFVVMSRFVDADPAGAVWALPLALIAGGLPDVLDSQHAAGRAPLGISWSGIRRDSARIVRRANRAGRLAGLPTVVLEHLFLLPRVLGALLVDGIARAIPHRSLTHWGATWMVLSLAPVIIARLAGAATLALPLAFSAGYLSHILTDMMTLSGVPVCGPFWQKRLHVVPRFLRFRYDAAVQWLVVAGAWGAAIYLTAERINQMVGAGGG